MHLCNILEESQQAVEEFVECHNNDKAFAKEVFKFIRDTLINLKEWELCALYMQDAQYEYERILDIFDKCMDMHPINYEWAEDFKEKFIRDVDSLCLILKENQKTSEVENILKQAYKDMESRGHIDMKFLSE